MYRAFQQIMKDSFLKQRWGWHVLKTWCMVGAFLWQYNLPLVFCFYPKPIPLRGLQCNVSFYKLFNLRLFWLQTKNKKVIYLEGQAFKKVLRARTLVRHQEFPCIHRTFFSWTLSLLAWPTSLICPKPVSLSKTNQPTGPKPIWSWLTWVEWVSLTTNKSTTHLVWLWIDLDVSFSVSELTFSFCICDNDFLIIYIRIKNFTRLYWDRQWDHTDL